MSYVWVFGLIRWKYANSNKSPRLLSYIHRSYLWALLVVIGLSFLAKRFIPAENFYFEFFLFGLGLLLGAVFKDIQWKMKKDMDKK